MQQFDELQTKLQTVMATERARHLARAELTQELIAHCLATMQIKEFELTAHWQMVIATLLKQGLGDQSLMTLLKGIYLQDQQAVVDDSVS